jgi:carboxyl-terminal processing protease
MNRLALGAILASASIAVGQVKTDSMAVYDEVQQRRTEAERLWRQKDDRGIGILKQLLQELETPLDRDLAQGNPYLFSRTANIHYDLAVAYATRGNLDAALSELEEVLASGGSGAYKEGIEKEAAFGPLRSLPRYADLMQSFAAESRLWSDGVFATGFKSSLSTEEKIAGLSRFWAEVKFAFPFFTRRADLDWDRLYESFIPKVLSAQTTLEYYQDLQRFCALLRDGHTNVYYPNELLEAEYVRPPIRSALVEGKVILVEISSATVRRRGLKLGDEIVEIDGSPVATYARERVIPFQSSSTPQDLNVRTFTYALLRGPKVRPLDLLIRDVHTTALRSITVPRTGYNDIESPVRLEARVLQNNVGYLLVNDFGDSKIMQLFDAAWPTVSQTTGLIIDLRRNGGGSSSYGWRMLACLTDKPFRISKMKSRVYNPYFRTQGFQSLWYTLPNSNWKPDTKRQYLKPVIVLSSAATFSAAEDFLIAFRSMRRGLIAGEPSAGSTGAPLFFALPGGGSARVCTKWDSYPDGQDFVGIGVKPDVEVKPTIRGIAEGRDEVLETAIRMLSGK